MYTVQKWSSREKLLFFIIILLGAILLSGWKPSKAAVDDSDQRTKSLYEKAKSFGQVGDLGPAVAYLYAYMQRDPVAYVNNTQGHRDEVDRVFFNWIEKIRSDQHYAATVKMHLESCELYPCDQKKASEGGLTVVNLEVFPADLVRVCEGANYKGKCSYLKPGDYTRWQNLGVKNDSISSLMVGEDVKVLLCAHRLDLLSECMEFTKEDSNLTDNIFPKHGYSINDTVSTARVTYKPGRGLTLP